MKMVKSLLLGAAAGIVGVAGAQAADLPVKAKPVQYVKICSLYGVGFYYIPGTDMCIKIGGWARIQYQYGVENNATNGPFLSNLNNRFTNDSTWRSRGYITTDARNQTPYGTVRAYAAIGYIDGPADVGGSAPGFQALRAFIQWAGFTFGQANSFFDFYVLPATSYLAAFPTSTTGGSGWKVLAYTAQFGNGFSGTISAEMRRTTQIVCAADEFGGGGIVAGCGDASLAGAGQAQSSGTVNPWGAAAFSPLGYGGFQTPDIVGNLRVDQAWGSAQLMGALHQVNAQYYDDDGAIPGATAGAGEGAGHPGDRWGFAVGAGIKLNAPMIGPGDYFQAQTQYTEGASRYTFQLSNFNQGDRHGQDAAYGVVSDAVFGGTIGAAANATGLQLTSTWGVNAAFEHHWNDQWQTSLYGGYAEMKYNATANAILCGLEGDGNVTGVFNATGTGSSAVALNGCDNNWSTWWIGSRTQWNVTKDFYMGVDVLYTKLNSANAANNELPNAMTPFSTTGSQLARFLSNEDALSVEFRVHKDFYP